MPSPAAPPLDRSLAALIDWWRQAGVDAVFGDTPQAWLNHPNQAHVQSLPPTACDFPTRTRESPPTKSEPKPPRRFGGDPKTWPADLAAFRQWWMTEPTLSLGGTAPRVASRGPTNARLLVLVPMPEPGDRETLLAGPEGALIGNMLAAMGIAPDEAFIGAALPAHLVAPDWATAAHEGLGAVLLHHVTLARPQRLLVLGRTILPLLGHDPPHSPATFRDTTIREGVSERVIPTLAGFAPGRLLENARQRALLWRQWLEWTNEKG